MGECKFCGKTDRVISSVLQICRSCIFNQDWDLVHTHILHIHDQIRQLEGLPEKPPKAKKEQVKLTCNLCLNECTLSTEDTSYCGLRNYKKNKTAELPLPSKSQGYIHGYIDPNPTNCCNAWICPAGTSRGYPEYSIKEGPEYGTYSYAAFLYGCTFNCLFCQNASHKHFSKRRLLKAESLAEEVYKNEKITCLCFFGGTPEAQFPFSVNIAKKILEQIEYSGVKRPMRICWEWNGSSSQDWVEKCMKIAIKTGGSVKFDLKSFHEKLNIALCGVSNERTLSNFKFLAENYFGKRKNLPEMSACTLMVPGYTNHEEVEQIAKFISSINPQIPYSLLVFHPDYQMGDLPITPLKQAEKSVEIAKNYLSNVHLGNRFLLKF